MGSVDRESAGNPRCCRLIWRIHETRCTKMTTLVIAGVAQPRRPTRAERAAFAFPLERSPQRRFAAAGIPRSVSEGRGSLAQPARSSEFATRPLTHGGAREARRADRQGPSGVQRAGRDRSSGAMPRPERLGAARVHPLAAQRHHASAAKPSPPPSPSLLLPQYTALPRRACRRSSSAHPAK